MFWLDPITFLGNVILGEGIHVDSQKVDIVKHWPMPITPSEIGSFLALSCYYKKFVKGFYLIAEMLTKMIKNKVNLQWLNKCMKFFHELKDRLNLEPMLALQDALDRFICTVILVELG